MTAETFNPWRELAAHPDVLLDIAHLKRGRLGVTWHRQRVIQLDDGLDRVERRCVLAHELAHWERGPVPCIPVLAAREEATCDLIAARRLIPLDALADLAWCDNLGQAAEELDVTEDVLACRLDHLTDSERDHLAATATL
jgi:Zn-dependent peptidase ImmA (M78 family)